jgi:hypothetical protein
MTTAAYTLNEILMTYEFQWMGLKSSQWVSGHEDHVMGVEGGAYKVRY